MKIPNSNTSLITVALRAAGALHDHEESIGILHNTETAVRGDVAAFTSAVDGFGDAKFIKSDSFIAHALAFSTAVNEAGPSAPSAEVEITVPLAEAA